MTPHLGHPPYGAYALPRAAEIIGVVAQIFQIAIFGKRDGISIRTP